jgi:threonine/homoserine/homoserine lactone efflux protein
VAHPATLLTFAVLELTLCLVPGPAVMLTVSTALRRGPARGAAAMAGIIAGNTLYFALSALGVVALVLASYRVFTVLKWAGAAYLAFLGLRALLARESAPGAAEAGEAELAEADVPWGRGSRVTAFASGFVTQVANPKAIVFFVAVLPQFLDPRGNLALQMIVLAAISQLAEFAVLSGYIAAAASLRRNGAATRAAVWIERAGGAVLLAIAARIAREPLVAR